jgi:hypothetical protein
MTELHRFWLRFAIAPGDLDRFPSYAGLGLGCGVTAYSLDDAKQVLGEVLFRGDPLPEIEEAIEDVDVRDLDQGRVIPNMGPPNERGVWFPQL